MPSPDIPASIPIALAGGRSYAVHFAELVEVPVLLAASGLTPRRCLIVTDEHVAEHYRTVLETALIEAGWTPLVRVIPPGEDSKAAVQLHALYDVALSWGIDRSTPVLALGGGVVGDLAGYAAATLLRGLPLIQLPTSLIAQVDSALGGKTGINHTVGKNLIGAFHQPRFVATDLTTLATLPDREWTSGLAEVVKHALIADAAFFDFLEDHWTQVLARDEAVIAEVVPHAARIKAEVVSEDEREQGRRAILNFGHTFGHAIERVAGYGRLTHGEAVALGMRAALHLSTTLHPDEDFTRAKALVRHLPIQGSYADLAIPDLVTAMQSDKKVSQGQVRFIVLRRPGDAYVTGEIAPKDVEKAWEVAFTD
ncbi:MAG TPA: 3-dehydroquinate synthase [Rhodothermales bacterium]|nr:3-dehydroquinate synthase [Rhodothermales bacterium]